jgi:hypothetical protein
VPLSEDDLGALRARGRAVGTAAPPPPFGAPSTWVAGAGAAVVLGLFFEPGGRPRRRGVGAGELVVVAAVVGTTPGAAVAFGAVAARGVFFDPGGRPRRGGAAVVGPVAAADAAGGAALVAVAAAGGALAAVVEPVVARGLFLEPGGRPRRRGVEGGAAADGVVVEAARRRRVGAGVSDPSAAPVASPLPRTARPARALARAVTRRTDPVAPRIVSAAPWAA